MINWKDLSPKEASVMLFTRCVELILKDEGYKISADTSIKILTQRLYGDYRQIHNTPEFKRAEKHVKHYKSTGLGHELF
jgi:hypothetical protein